MKKQIEKQIEKINSMIGRITEYNAYLNDNTYYANRGAKQLSFDVKFYAYLTETEVEKCIKGLRLSKKRTAQVMDEFNEDRLSGVYYHFISDNQELFTEDLDSKDSPYYYMVNKKDVGFYGRQGGHLCLGDVSSFELNIDETEIGNWPAWEYEYFGKGESGLNWPEDIDVTIAQLKEHFRVTTQKEVYRELRAEITKGDLAGFYNSAISNTETLENLEKQIKDFKANAQKYLEEMLQQEIDTFIQEEFGEEMAIKSAEAGDRSQLDSIKQITGAYVVTNRNAKVPTTSAIYLLNAIISGRKVTGMKIGSFMVNRVTKKRNDTYIKIGCHLFSLKDARQQFVA